MVMLFSSEARTSSATCRRNEKTRALEIDTGRAVEQRCTPTTTTTARLTTTNKLRPHQVHQTNVSNAPPKTVLATQFLPVSALILGRISQHSHTNHDITNQLTNHNSPKLLIMVHQSAAQNAQL